MKEYLQGSGRPLAHRITLMDYKELFRRDSLERGTYIFSALDQLSPAALEWADRICQEIDGVEGMRSVNAPRRTLKRYELLRALHDSGRNSFDAARATEKRAKLHFPVFLREENGHTGSLTGLLFHQSDLDRARGELLWKGHDLRRLLIVEYCDTRDEWSWYRRYAAFVVGGEIVPRSLVFSRNWVAKAGSRVVDERMILEESRFISDNPHETSLREISVMAGVEYGRIDYAIHDGKVETWEINLNPTIGGGPGSRRRARLPEEIERRRAPAKEIFYQRFRSALGSLDAAASCGESVRLSPNPAMGRKLRAEEKRRRRSERLESPIRGARRLLGPLKPILKPALELSSPVIARVRLWLA
jgi:hypothetical protein